MLSSIILLIVLICLNAIFASAEIAVISISSAKLKKMSEDGNKKAKKLLWLTEQPAKFLATIQVAITLAGFLQSAFAANTFATPLVNWLISLGVPTSYSGILETVSIVVITVILGYFNLVFGELVPKRVAMKKSESLAMALAGMLYFVAKVFKPIVWVLTASTNAIIRLFGINPNETDETVTEDEILMMLEEGNEQGTILEEENEIIQNVFEFNDITAGDIATHRVNVDILWTEDDISTWEQTIHKTRHTLYPVCDTSADNVVGILNAKDFFALKNKSMENVLKEAVHPAYFVPESIKADVLFKNMKETQNNFAVILDERGGMEGIVTLLDLIEELVGDLNEKIADEDGSEPAITQIADNQWKITGNVPLDELSKETDTDFESDEYNTLTGLAFDVLGIIPSDGEQDTFIKLPNADIRITKVEDHQISEAIITIIPQSNEDDDEE